MRRNQKTEYKIQEDESLTAETGDAEVWEIRWESPEKVSFTLTLKYKPGCELADIGGIAER